MRRWARDWGETEPPKTEYFQARRPDGSVDPFDESDRDWGFHNPLDLLKPAYAIMRNSDFAAVPTPDQIEHLLSFPGWLDDLLRMHRIVRFWSEDHPVVGFFTEVSEGMP